MIGKSTIIWVGLAAIASGNLYQTSYRVQEESDKLAVLNRQIVSEQESIQILKAEWAHLNDPARLEPKVAEYMLLVPVRASQMAALSEVPARLAEGEQVQIDSMPVPARKPGHHAPTDRPKPAPQARPSGPLVLAQFGGDR